MQTRKQKTVLAVTGIRSEYDILYPILRLMETSTEYDLKVVVCGAHLSDAHGNTWQTVEKRT